MEIYKYVKPRRITKIQRRRLLEFMKKNRQVGKGLCVTREQKKYHSAVWAAVAKELNALSGPSKTPVQWKKCWIDWKASVKKQYFQKTPCSRTDRFINTEETNERNDFDKDVVEFFAKNIDDYDDKILTDCILENDGDVDSRVNSDTPSEPFVDLTDADDNEENANSLDETPNEFMENSLNEYPEWSQSISENRAPSNQSLSDDGVRNQNHTQIMDALNKITGLIENQNAILNQMLCVMHRQN